MRSEEQSSCASYCVEPLATLGGLRRYRGTSFAQLGFLLWLSICPSESPSGQFGP